MLQVEICPFVIIEIPNFKEADAEKSSGQIFAKVMAAIKDGAYRGKEKGEILTKDIGVAVLVDTSVAILTSVVVRPGIQTAVGEGLQTEVLTAAIGAISGKVFAATAEGIVGKVSTLKKVGAFVGMVLGGGLGMIAGLKASMGQSIVLNDKVT